MRRFVVALLVSLGFGAFGLWLAFRGALLAPESYRFDNARPAFIVVVLITFFLQLLAPAVRLALLSGYHGLPLRIGDAMLIHVTSVFGAAITPSNSGGAPVTVMALSSIGMPVGKSIGLASQLLILDLIFYSWAGPLGLAYLIQTGTITVAFNAFAVTAIAAVVSVTLAVLISRYPRLVTGILLALARRSFLRRFSKRITAVARDYFRSAVVYLEFSSGKYVALQLLTALGWFATYLILWGMLGLYGVVRDPLFVTALLTEITLLANFVPTPGGSGFIEAITGMMAGGPSATSPLIVWRLLTFYLFFLLGPIAGWILYHSKLSATSKDEGRNSADVVEPRT